VLKYLLSHRFGAAANMLESGSLGLLVELTESCSGHVLVVLMMLLVLLVFC
jgi:hypothetical protein